MPIVDTIIVTILPDYGQRVRADSLDVVDPCGRCIFELLLKYLGVRLGAHILMTTTTGGTWACRSEQSKRVDTNVTILPVDCKFPGLFVCGDVGWFFVHAHSLPKNLPACISLQYLFAKGAGEISKIG